jgi:SAM-dependent methyltransferase
MEFRAHADAAMNGLTERTISSYAQGDISAEIAVMRLLLFFGDVARTTGWLTVRASQRGTAGLPSPAPGEELGMRAAAALLAVIDRHQEPLAALAALLDEGLTREAGSSIAAIRTQFDRAVALAPEASVALYSLGSVDVLDRATAEIVMRLDEWGLLGPPVRVLDIGCGIGRIERALASRVGAIVGIDLSPAMIAEARSRCAGLANVALAACSGADLADFAGRQFGLVLAVDSFPYMVAADPAIAARHVADAAGLLVCGGAVVILNYSYRGDLDADRADVARIAAAAGLEIERSGTRDFTLWDGTTFVLRK